MAALTGRTKDLTCYTVELGGGPANLLALYLAIVALRSHLPSFTHCIKLFCFTD